MAGKGWRGGASNAHKYEHCYASGGTIFLAGPPLVWFPVTYGAFRNDYVVDDYQM